VETNNKQAQKRLSNALPELRQTWTARQYLLRKIAENGFSVNVYLKEKQLSMLDAIDTEVSAGKRTTKARKKTRTKKTKK
jgi:hypothetical protein